MIALFTFLLFTFTVFNFSVDLVINLKLNLDTFSFDQNTSNFQVNNMSC